MRAAAERSLQAAFLHRLHCVALVVAGYGCNAVATAFDEDWRSVQRWVRRFEEAGAAGLADGAPGPAGEARRGTLTHLRSVLAQPPAASGHAGEAWSPEAVRLEVQRRFDVAYSLRQCTRLLDRLAREPAREIRGGSSAAPRDAT